VVGQQRSHFDPGIRLATATSLQAEKASEDAWFAHLQVLASDDLKGRRTGTPEFLRAVDYVESQFKSIGLAPAGVDGYRQPVGFRSVAVDEEHSNVLPVAADGQLELTIKHSRTSKRMARGEGLSSPLVGAVYSHPGFGKLSGCVLFIVEAPVVMWNDATDFGLDSELISDILSPL
jgi:hypothetical protein